ncbi:MAG: winged helix-turn-helix transcriptional regulator [Clostridiales bacterium]|nr:winged helix-turn-helix transcriptional regulator [Clostridiales bacterium]
MEKEILMLSDEKISELATDFKAISDEGRLKIIIYLLDGKRSVGEISTALNISQSSTSHALRILKDAKILRCEKSGNVIYYYVNDDHVRTIIEKSIEHLEC